MEEKLVDFLKKWKYQKIIMFIMRKINLNKFILFMKGNFRWKKRYLQSTKY